MTNHSRARRTTGAALITSAVAGAGLLVGAGGAMAAASGPVSAGACEASALELSVLGSVHVQANRAGSTTAPCRTDRGALDIQALGLVDATTVEATTTATANLGAAAQSTVEGLRIGAGSVANGLTGSLLGGTGDLGGELEAALAPLLGTDGLVTDALAPLRALGLDVVGVDSTALLAQSGANLPSALAAALPDLVSAGLIDARAGAVCSNGVATLTGRSQLTGLTVLGSPIDVNDPAEKVLSLDTAKVTLSELVSVNAVLRSITVQAAPLSPLGLVVGGGYQSLYSLLTSPSGGLLGAVNGLLPVGSTLQTVLDGLSTSLQPVIDRTQVALPTGLLRATVSPRVQRRTGNTLSESALELTVTALSQPILSGTLARAQVSTDAAGCLPTNPPPTGPVDPQGGPGDGPSKIQGGPDDPARFSSDFAEEALRCETVRLRLLDVRQAGALTYVQGVAERQYVGSTATIYERQGNRKVGTTTVRANGSFATRVSLPAQKIRHTSKARYYAIISGQRTKALKFTRRMTSTKVAMANGRVTFSGRTTGPRAAKQEVVKIQQRLSCKTYSTVATVKPDAKGFFKATFKPAAGTTTGVYRAYTRVPSSAPSRRLKPTYTLPRLLAVR